MNVRHPISTLVVQSPNRFKETVNRFKEVCEFPHYRVNDGVASVEPKVTLGGNTCTILGMSNGEESYIGHFAPEFLRGDFNQKLDLIIKKFMDKTGELSAIITGGYSRFADGGSAEAVKSFEQSARVAEVLDKYTSDITMISGKRNPVFTDCLAVDGDRFILSHSKKVGVNNSTPHLKQNPTPQEIQAELYKNYEIADLDGTSTVIFEV